MTRDECLDAAWTYCAPQRLPELFPTGFWPSVARVAIEMYIQQTDKPKLDFTPSYCTRGQYPDVRVRAKNKTGVDLSKMEINL